MQITVLKSKLKRVFVTGASVNYEGSLTLDEDLMDAAHLRRNERVEVNSVEGFDRIVTYVIAGERGSGCVELNGGAANFFAVGDAIHVNCFASYNDAEMDEFDPTEYIPESIVVETDEQNKVIK